MPKKIIHFIIIVVLTACSEIDTPVNWSTYSPIVKQRIDKAVAVKNCKTLQIEFNSADKNSEIHRARHGTSNANLMGYLDNYMQVMGCYK